MFNRLILVTLAIITIFSSCTIEDSADVNQAKIYADYDLRYDANTDKTRVVATFKFGGATGTNLQLSDPAQVVFNGEIYNFLELKNQYLKNEVFYSDTIICNMTNISDVIFFTIAH